MSLAARPEGTDGSDHVYREKVAKAYQVVGRTRRWAGLIQYFSVLPAILRAIWFIAGNYYGGLTINTPAIAIVACNLGGVLLWYLAKTGTSRESFHLVRIAGILHVSWTALLVTTCYKYHKLTSYELHTDTRMYLYLKHFHGLEGVQVMNVLDTLDRGLDCMCFVCACVIFGNLHPYIMVQINMKKAARTIEEEAQGTQKSEKKAVKAAETAKDTSASKGGPVKRRPARM